MVNVEDLPDDGCAAFQMNAEIQMDKPSSEIIDELAEKGIIEKNKLFTAEMLSSITKYASILKFNDMHMPCEFVFSDKDGGVLPGLFHGFMFVNVEINSDDSEQTITFKIFFRIAFVDNDTNENKYIFGILNVTYQSTNPSEQECNDLTQYVLSNIARA